VENPRNGIYSYFVRGFNTRIDPEIMNKIKQYAMKVIESEESILVVGKNWVVVGKKIHDSEYERIEVRCFKDICETHEEILPRYLDYVVGVVESVEVDCSERKIIDYGIADYTCSIQYNYYKYSVIIAVTIDPLDIHKLNNDKELQLLLDLMSFSTLLVRPM